MKMKPNITKKIKAMSPLKMIKWGVISGLVVTAIVLVSVLTCGGPTAQRTIEESFTATPTLLDSIKSIKQWQLVETEQVVEVDSSRSRYAGMIHDYIKRRYYGKLSIGIDMENVPENWYSSSHDSITVNLPDVILLDEKFIDESKTLLVQCNDKGFESDKRVRQKMYDKACYLMKQKALTERIRQQARKQADDELTRLLRQTGYKHIEVKFK